MPYAGPRRRRYQKVMHSNQYLFKRYKCGWRCAPRSIFSTSSLSGVGTRSLVGMRIEVLGCGYEEGSKGWDEHSGEVFLINRRFVFEREAKQCGV